MRERGSLLWEYDPAVSRDSAVNACCDVVNRGVAAWNGKVYFGTLDGRLMALDAATGKLAWEKLTVDPKWRYTITGAPRVVKGKVLIGNGGAELGVRGYISAYDAESGEMKWRFYTVPGDPSQPFEAPDPREGGADLDRPVVEARGRGNRVGFDGLRPEARPSLYRRRQRFAVESQASQSRRR